jgi:hypothetical protein
MRRIDIVRCPKGLPWSFNAAQASGLLNTKATMDAKPGKLGKSCSIRAIQRGTAHELKIVCHRN